MCKLDKTETLATIGDMTYVREVTETDFHSCMCLYFQFDSICVFSFYPSNVMLLRHIFCGYICFPNVLVERGCGLHILPTLVIES